MPATRVGESGWEANLTSPAADMVRSAGIGVFVEELGESAAVLRRAGRPLGARFPASVPPGRRCRCGIARQPDLHGPLLVWVPAGFAIRAFHGPVVPCPVLAISQTDPLKAHKVIVETAIALMSPILEEVAIAGFDRWYRITAH